MSLFSQLSKILVLFLALTVHAANSLPFVGRNAELLLLRRHSFDRSRVIIVTGVSGIGKTALVRKFINQNLGKYDFVCWFYGGQNFEDGLINCGHYLGRLFKKEIVNAGYSREANIKMVIEYLYFTKKKGAFIFDNFFEITPISKLPNRKNFTFIVTSLNRFNLGKTIVLRNLSEEDAVKLIRDSLFCTIQDATELASVLNYYPLAITQAVSYISTRPGMNVTKYLEIYNKSYKDLLIKEEELVKEGIIDKAVYSTLSLTLENLKQTNEYAYQLMHYLALCNRNVPLTILKGFYLNTIHNKEIEFFEALATLQKYSLIEISDPGLCSCHDMVAKVLKAKLDDKMYKQIVEKAVLGCSTFKYLRPAEVGHYDQEGYIPAYFGLIAQEAKRVQALDRVDDLLIKYLQFLLIEKRQYINADKIIKELEYYYKHEYSTNALNQVRFHLFKGILLAWYYADYNKSNTEYYYALDILKNFPANIEDMFDIYLQLAQNYCFLGDLEKARQYAFRAEQYSVEDDTTNNETLKYVNAAIYLGNGMYQNALNVMQGMAPASPNQSKIAPYYYEHCILYGRILGKMRRFEEASLMLHKLYDSFEQTFGTKIHDTYMSLCAALAETAKFRKDWVIMKQYLAEMQRYCPKIYKNEEINQAEYHRLMGDYHFFTGSYNLAFHDYEIADVIYSRIFTQLRHDDIKQLWQQKMRASYKLGLSREYAQCLDKYRSVFGDIDLKDVVEITYE